MCECMCVCVCACERDIVCERRERERKGHMLNDRKEEERCQLTTSPLKRMLVNLQKVS